ncbi:Long-chain-fatty-acid--CoA ligase [Candidatus Rhodobacter oscarellae]|uniref:Long-chain-fatty-acid--CoA ligase n=1 Tax=Candidatus Rhodobacter oscarellae TaxID=1675527 RepID=A0A0J9EA76_9RHOB|nr:AMP-binding protein [Candidatus Rhodobacter lobularis]KMW59682.1 Long-chain-fatty-acid--CoA ligase [Candidatus Rhodobacter lobularis]
MSQSDQIDPAFVTDSETRVDRDEFESRASQGAAALIALGAGADVPIAIIMRNDLTQLEIMRAAALAGTVIVALNWHAAAEEVADICDDSGARLVITHRGLLERLLPALEGRQIVGVCPTRSLCEGFGIGPEQAKYGAQFPEWNVYVEAQAPLQNRTAMRPFLRYTSGSTGKPKGVRRLQTGLRKDFEIVLQRVASEMLRLRPGAKFFTAAPLYHSAPSTLVSAAMVASGVSTLLAPQFDAEGFLAMIEAERVTHIYLVPTMMSRMLKLPADVRNKYDLSSVEFCVSTGSPWSHDLKVAMIEWWGPVFWESYGATEIGFMTMVSSEEALERPGTAGRMQLGASVLIFDSEGNELPPGEVGEIYVRQDAFGGFDYSNDPEARADVEKHGHYSVGDLGWLDEDGYLFITDRKKDMIVSVGANVFPAEIEGILLRAPFIYDVAVFGAPDPEFGEQVVAAIQPAANWDPNVAEVLNFLDGKLARFKHPRIVDFHEALPREDSGKVFKPRLREPYWRDVARRI